MSFMVATCEVIKRAREYHAHAAAAIAGGACAIGYGYLAHLSRVFDRVDVFAYLGVHFFITAIVLGLFWVARARVSLSARAVIFWAIVFRVIAIYGAPVLEDDYFRYLLDGCVFVTSGTPYGISPASLFAGNNLPAECQILLSRVNYPSLPTIYAPVLQYVFAALYVIAPANITALQLTLSLVDLSLIAMLCRCAPARYVLLYAWCPLAIKEIAFTAHPDIIGVALLLAALYFRARGRLGLAVMLAGLACATKIFAVLLLPFVLWKLAPRYWLLCAATVLVLYAPFVLQGATDLATLGVFMREWQFNAGVFALLSDLFGGAHARIIYLGLFILWFAFYFWRWHRACAREKNFIFPRGDWVFGVFFLLSPVINPWYFVWLLPFAVLRPQLWQWAWVAVLPVSYVYGLNLLHSELGAFQMAGWAYYGQLIVLAIAGGGDLARHLWVRRKNLNAATPRV